MAESMNKLDGKRWLQYSFSIWKDIRKNKEENKLKHPAMFPTHLTSRIIEIFTKDDGEVILDPFMGIGSTIISSRELNRKGIGFELSKEYTKIAKERLSEVQKSLNNLDKDFIKPEIYNEDSRNISKFLEKDSVDLCITSPPYWDILNQKRTADKRDIKGYSKSKKDLGNIENYEKFLEEIKKVFSNVYKVLKPNKRCVVVVMDIRKKDKFFPLHIDLTRKMEEIGFELEDVIIWDRQHEYNNCRTLGYPWVFRINKLHEFICIYIKK